MQYNLLKKTILFIFILACLGVGLVVIHSNYVGAQSGSSDAIAIRVIPNTLHHSARVWYAKQNFSGSPQSLTVDGYDAIRDGRSVYVNAANTSGINLFTNIYLISYNQNAHSATVDIFGNILNNWKFNTNLDISSICVLDNNIACLTDEDCPIGDYCNSDKAKVTRDVRRLADISDIEANLEKYRVRGNYPKLAAGSYLRYTSLSVWPSWKDTLGRDLGTRLPVDPVNRMGLCTGYNPTTCWDEVNESFASTLPVLPTNSLVYVYNTDADGLVANVCANFESTTWDIVAPPSCSLNVCMDYDGDGYGRPSSSLCAKGDGLDCNDLDPNITTGAAAETCGNAIDDDCNGLIDCDDPGCPACSTPVFCGDGLCNGSDTCATCPGDCGPCGAGTCPDGVCDESSECGGPPPGGCYGIGLDCGCGNGNIECGEQCDDGNNVPGDGCSGTCTWECTDNDNDYYILQNTNYSDCDLCGPTGIEECLGNNDCDDSLTAEAPNINPGKIDLCNGYDDDCNATTIDGSGDPSPPLNTNQTGVCSGSTRACAGFITGWTDNYENVGNYELVEFTCIDKLDNDCDNTCDMIDDACPGLTYDPDCTGNCTGSSERDFVAVGESDCNQCDHPGDDDGNQSEGAFDLYSGALIDTTDADWIAAGHNISWVDDCDNACGPGASVVHLNTFEFGSETLCDGIDNDCDGAIDEQCDVDNDDYCAEGLTVTNNAICPNTPVGTGDDCNDSDDTYYPNPAAEVCGDGFDQDCNGPDLLCAAICDDAGDGDGYGVCPNCNTPLCLNEGDDCDPLRPFINPGAVETCDGYDNNCSDPDHTVIDPNEVDEGCDDDGDDYCDETFLYFPLNFDGSPFPPSANPCSNSILAADDCNDVAPVGFSINPGGAEIGNCDNGEDDDCDTLTDCADPDCSTELSCATCCTFTATLPCDLCP